METSTKSSTDITFLAWKDYRPAPPANQKRTGLRTDHRKSARILRKITLFVRSVTITQLLYAAVLLAALRPSVNCVEDPSLAIRIDD